MPSELLISHRELTENPTPRVPVCLVLDCSGSMENEPINELNNGVRLFMDTIRKDEVASASAEISIVTFGGKVRKSLDFGHIDRQDIPTLTAVGETPMGEAVNLALHLLDERKNLYQSAGVPYYQPWMVLMTDGVPTDDIKSAAQRASDLAARLKLTVLPVGIGASANLDTLRLFSPRREPARLKGLQFDQFFEWLSASIYSLSTSGGPGSRVTLPSPSGWTDIEST